MVPVPLVGAAVVTPVDAVTVASLGRTQRRLVLASLAIVVTLAWVVIAAGGSVHDRLLAPHHQHPIVTGFTLALLMWLVMAAAMMLPPLVPWVVTLIRLTDRDRARALVSVPLFVGGYLLVWTGYSAVAAGIQVVLHRAALVSDAGRVLGPLAAVTLLAAGAYQFSRLKCGTLTHCRNPLSFFLTRWNNGPGGAAGLGFRHGLSCLGCCWALMALSFVLGVMNVVWMAALTLVVCIEKLAPRGELWSRAIGAAFVVWGLGLLVW